MSLNLPNWYVQQYSQNILHLAQQKMSRLRKAVSFGSYVGASASPVDQLGLLEMQDVVSRFAPMGRQDIPQSRRWVAPIDADLPQLIDSFDKLKILTDPNSKYVQAAVQAANRKFDDRIGNAFFGSAMTGVTGATATTFPSSQVVGVSTGGTTSNLNVAKLEAGRAILLANEALGDEDNGEKIYVCITATEHQSLLNEIQVISTDFNKEVVFDETGIIRSWRGFHFIRSQRSWLTTTQTDDLSGSSKAIPMWVPSGMHLGIWNEIDTSIDVRADLQGRPWQAYTKMSANATRLEETKVVKIWCR